MCECINVEIGSYDNTVVLDVPPHMEQYKINRVAAGLSDKICVDKCIQKEIENLWALEITTYGCCCGHNKLHGFIQVHEKDFDKMLILGYEIEDADKKSFFPMSIGR